MNNTTITLKSYIGNIGWSGNAKHIVIVDECTCEKFEGVHSHTDAYAICKPNLGYHYTIGGVTQIKKIAPTLENITCKSCLRRIV